MNIEPTDDDLRDILSRLGADPASFEEKREWLLGFWERIVHQSIRRSYGDVLGRTIHEMMTPPPSLHDKRIDW